MLILGIDTATKTASAAVFETEADRVLCEIKSNGKLSHSENLMPMIDYTLKCAGAELSDIDLFAVANGPGSFTGIRIGVATIKGLAFRFEFGGACENNCVGVSSMLSLAYNFYGDGRNNNNNKASDILILPVIDARRRQVYNAVLDNKLNYIKKDRIITTDMLEAELNAEFAGRKIIFAGDAAGMCSGEIDFDGKIYAPEALKIPSAASLCRAAREKYKNGGAVHPRMLAPSYLIKTQAENERERGSCSQT
jgi:tRNA threonylcarbamoyladenosine biosynthesis protein TsaB